MAATNRSSSAAARETMVERIIEAGIVAVIRMQDASKLMKVAQALREGGVFAMEITMTVPGAIELIREVSAEMGNEIILGVGSVLDADTAQRAIDAGARYIVSPVFKPEIVTRAHENGSPAMPGCMTPTEIQGAHDHGADIIKVFPADIVGMAFFRAVKAPMPHVRLMPTGGVSLTNAGDWLAAGACAVGVGSALLDKQAIADNEFDIIAANARTLKSGIDAARKLS